MFILRNTPIYRERDTQSKAGWIRDRSIRVGLLLALVTMVGVGCSQQSGSDTQAGGIDTPVASFSNGVTSGLPGLAVEFSDTSTGSITSRMWDFGNGLTSTEINPVVVYSNSGLFTVALTVTGSRGTSTLTRTNLVDVADAPTAGFSCSVGIGFAPVVTTCTNQGTVLAGTTAIAWDFGDGTFSNEENPTHTYDTPGEFTLTQTITTAGGSATLPTLISVRPFVITIDPLTGGGGPGDFLLSLDAGELIGTVIWAVDGIVVGSGRNSITPFRSPGTFTVTATFLSTDPPLVGSGSTEHVVNYGPPVAAFRPSQVEGAGPLSVTMIDQSTGEITQWEWDFGDGTTCDYPTLRSSMTLCESSEPTHIYNSVERFDVGLVVTGLAENADNPTLTDSFDFPSAVSVTILDPSFENQLAGSEIAGGWTTLRPVSATAVAQHIALSDSTLPGDAGMPTDGSTWAALDGLGTDGSTGALVTNNGIQTTFMRPASRSVLEFDYALLYSEPTLSGTLDEMTATVSDGVTTVEIDSARASIDTPYASGSSRFPVLDSSTTRVTAVQTAGINLDIAFPGADPDLLYTLTIRLTNARNTSRSPRAYVDGIRFTDPADPIGAAFALETNPVVAGQGAFFTDETCLLPSPSTCAVPTSWRWDFGTQFLATPQPTTGSGEQSPSYLFPEAGAYVVTMVVRKGDQESEATMNVSVIGAPVASFDAVFAGPNTGPGAVVRFTSTSTSDPTDAIVGWSWDFAGFGEASTEGPHDIVFPQSGDFPVRLTITTASGLTNTGEIDVTID